MQKGKLDQTAFTKISKQRPCWGKKHHLEVYEKRALETAEIRHKKPLLTAKQLAARLKFAKQYNNLIAEEWDFLFSDECPKYLFQLPNPKNDIVWGSQESQVPSAYQVKKVQNGSYRAEEQAAVSLGYIFYTKDKL